MLKMDRSTVPSSNQSLTLLIFTYSSPLISSTHPLSLKTPTTIFANNFVPWLSASSRASPQTNFLSTSFTSLTPTHPSIVGSKNLHQKWTNSRFSSLPISTMQYSSTKCSHFTRLLAASVSMPRLLNSRTFTWGCTPCSRAQERQFERGTPSWAAEGRAGASEG